MHWLWEIVKLWVQNDGLFVPLEQMLIVRKPEEYLNMASGTDMIWGGGSDSPAMQTWLILSSPSPCLSLSSAELSARVCGRAIPSLHFLSCGRDLKP